MNMNCSECGTVFKQRSARSKYCQKKCQIKANRRKNQIIHDKVCATCSKPFTTTKSQQRYCSTACADVDYSTHLGSGLNLSTGSIGAIAELMSSIELMKADFEVYRALSPSSSCDLLAIKGGKFYGFEVRTASAKKSGGYSYPAGKIRAKNIILVVHREGRIIIPQTCIHES